MRFCESGVLRIMSRQFRIDKLDIEFELPDKSNHVYIVGIDTYLGSHFAKYWLEAGSVVHGCGNSGSLSKDLRVVSYSKSDYSSWNFAGIDYDWIMVCLDPLKEISEYLGMIQGLCDYIENNKMFVHICYPSSFMICESNSKRAILENTSLTPHSEYEMNIAAAELYLNMRSCHQDSQLLTYILRMSEMYGNEVAFDDGNPLPGLINTCWHNASAGNPITMYGLGLKKRTVTHVADACRFAIKYMNLDFAPRTVNIPGEKLRVADFLMDIACHFNVETALASPEQHSVFCNRFAGDQVLSDKLALGLVPYKPQFTFRTWLAQQPVPAKAVVMA